MKEVEYYLRLLLNCNDSNKRKELQKKLADAIKKIEKGVN